MTCSARCGRFALGTVLILWAGVASADQPLPFEGTWVRADRACSSTAPSARTYTSKSLISPGGRCTIRKVAFGTGEFEIFEDCRRTERSGSVVEKIKMMGPDTLVLKYQTNRLKIPRGRKYTRCTVAAPKPGVLPIPGRSFTPTNALKPAAGPADHDAE